MQFSEYLSDLNGFSSVDSNSSDLLEGRRDCEVSTRSHFSRLPGIFGGVEKIAKNLWRVFGETAEAVVWDDKCSLSSGLPFTPPAKFLQETFLSSFVDSKTAKSPGLKGRHRLERRMEDAANLVASTFSQNLLPSAKSETNICEMSSVLAGYNLEGENLPIVSPKVDILLNIAEVSKMPNSPIFPLCLKMANICAQVSPNTQKVCLVAVTGWVLTLEYMLIGIDDYLVSFLKICAFRVICSFVYVLISELMNKSYDAEATKPANIV